MHWRQVRSSLTGWKTKTENFATTSVKSGKYLLCHSTHVTLTIIVLRLSSYIVVITPPDADESVLAIRNQSPWCDIHRKAIVVIRKAWRHQKLQPQSRVRMRCRTYNDWWWLAWHTSQKKTKQANFYRFASLDDHDYVVVIPATSPFSKKQVEKSTLKRTLTRKPKEWQKEKGSYLSIICDDYLKNNSFLKIM